MRWLSVTGCLAALFVLTRMDLARACSSGGPHYVYYDDLLTNLAAACDGSGDCLATFSRVNEVTADKANTVLSGTGSTRLATGPWAVPAGATRDGTRWLVLASEGGPTLTQANVDGAPTATTALSTSPYGTSSASIAAGTSTVGAVWLEPIQEGSPDKQVMFARFPSGSVVPSTRLTLGSPAVKVRTTALGDDFLVVWVDSSFHLVGEIVHADGRQEPVFFDGRIYVPGSAFQLASNGTHAVVTWDSSLPSFVLVDTQTNVSAPRPIPGAPEGAALTAWDGSRFVFVSHGNPQLWVVTMDAAGSFGTPTTAPEVRGDVLDAALVADGGRVVLFAIHEPADSTGLYQTVESVPIVNGQRGAWQTLFTGAHNYSVYVPGDQYGYACMVAPGGHGGGALGIVLVLGLIFVTRVNRSTRS